MQKAVRTCIFSQVQSCYDLQAPLENPKDHSSPKRPSQENLPGLLYPRVVEQLAHYQLGPDQSSRQQPDLAALASVVVHPVAESVVVGAAVVIVAVASAADIVLVAADVHACLDFGLAAPAGTYSPARHS